MHEFKKWVGEKRPIRKSVSISSYHESQLLKLETSCQLDLAEIMSLCISVCLNEPSFIKFIQDQFGKPERYRVIAIRKNSHQLELEHIYLRE